MLVVIATRCFQICLAGMECREVVDQVRRESSEAAECQVCTELQAEFAKNPGGLPMRRAGLVGAGLVGGAALAITTICVPFVLPALRRVCLPFVPATTAQLEHVSRALESGASSRAQLPRLLDIGSGDGRVVLLAARQGYRATGVELNR